ncbi:C-3 sterol dehydrogenase/C-4 decarboxylase-like protein [Phyllosticta citribraziliensis]|uniref:C-3 sterol dehydrogenase/C-4 decarboxylase-like protein n=1 Tax=Phyllosticta citribraziliensis TaxID=989973 RepID=A0ABR1M495_9PEZI
MPHEHVVVTGGCGFLGSAIVDAFLEAHPQYRYTILDIQPPEKGAAVNEKVNYAQVDLRDAAAVKRVVRETAPTVIIHTAGVVPAGSKRYSKSAAVRNEVFGVNVGGTRNILDAAGEVDSVKAIVYTGSLTVVGDDLDTDYRNVDESVQIGRAELFYGQSKAAAEQLVLNPATPHSFLTCALRPSVLFGPGDPSLLPPIAALAPSTSSPSPSSLFSSSVFQIPLSVVALGPCTNLYDFTYVTNAADAHVLAVRNLLQISRYGDDSSPSAAGRAFFITNDAPLPFRDFCRAVWAELGHVPPAEIRVPAMVARTMGLCADAVSALTGAEFALSAGAVRDALGTKYASGRAAREVLGYSPRVGMKEGVRRAVEDYKQQTEPQRNSEEKVKRG